MSTHPMVIVNPSIKSIQATRPTLSMTPGKAHAESRCHAASSTSTALPRSCSPVCTAGQQASNGLQSCKAHPDGAVEDGPRCRNGLPTLHLHCEVEQEGGMLTYLPHETGPTNTPASPLEHFHGLQTPQPCG